jgi:hypothetical protein
LDKITACLSLFVLSKLSGQWGRQEFAGGVTVAHFRYSPDQLMDELAGFALRGSPD